MLHLVRVKGMMTGENGSVAASQGRNAPSLVNTGKIQLKRDLGRHSLPHRAAACFISAAHFLHRDKMPIQINSHGLGGL
jgi:hypothetical protein